MAVGLGGGDQLGNLVSLLAVGGQEFDGGLNIDARQARIRVRIILLGSSAAVAVWETGLDARQVVLYPLGPDARQSLREVAS